MSKTIHPDEQNYSEERKKSNQIDHFHEVRGHAELSVALVKDWKEKRKTTVADLKEVEDLLGNAEKFLSENEEEGKEISTKQEELEDIAQKLVHILEKSGETIPPELQKYISDSKSEAIDPPEPSVVDVPPLVPTAEASKEKAKSTSEKKEKKKIIEIPGSELAELLKDGPDLIKEVKRLLMRPQNTPQAESIIVNLFQHVQENKFVALLKKYGYTPADFSTEWKGNWSKKLLTALTVEVDQLRVKVLEADKVGNFTESVKSNFSLARAGQLLARVGSVGLAVGLFTATATQTPLRAGAKAIGGAAGGFTKWLQGGTKKTRDILKKVDTKAQERTEEKRQLIQEERQYSEKTLGQMEKRIKEESTESLCGLLSGVLKQSSFEKIQTTYTEELGKDRKSMDFANQALLQQELNEHIARELKEAMGSKDPNEQETGVFLEWQKEYQEHRMDAVLMELYKNDADRFSQALEGALLRQPGLVTVLEKLSAFKNADLGKLISKEKQKQKGKEDEGPSKLFNTLNCIVHMMGGAAIGLALDAEPGLVKAISTGLAGGVLGARDGWAAEKKIEKMKLEKNIKQIISEAEVVLTKGEKNKKDSEPTPEKYAEWAGQLRTALNFGLIKKETTEWYRAHNVLREIEIRLYRERKPDEKMDSLLKNMNADLVAQVDAQEKRLLKIKKTGKKYAIAGGILGGVVGFIGGFALENSGSPDAHTELKSAEGLHSAGNDLVNIHHPEFATAGGVVATGPAHDVLNHTGTPIEHPSSGKIPESSHEPSTLTEIHAETKSFSSEISEIKKGEGILHAVDRLEKTEFGKMFELDRNWEIKELENMGFIFKDGKWGYPFTVHTGAKVELYSDETGPHLRLIAEGNQITVHDYYKFKTPVGEISKEVIEQSDQNAKDFSSRMNKVMDPKDPEFEHVRVGKGLMEAVRVKGHPMSGIAEVEPIPDTGNVRVTLEDHRVFEVHPEKIMESVPGSDHQNIVWKIDTLEHSPAIPLPDHTGGDITNSDQTVALDKVKASVMTPAQHEEWMNQQKTIHSSESGTGKGTTKPEVKPAVEAQQSVENKKLNVETISGIEIKQKLFTDELDKIKQQISENMRSINNPGKLGFDNTDLEHLMNDLKEHIKPEVLAKLSNTQIHDIANSVKLSPEMQLLLKPFDNTLAHDFANSVNHITGRAIILDGTSPEGEAISSVLLRVNEGGKTMDYIFSTPAGYKFNVIGNNIVVKDDNGNIADFRFTRQGESITNGDLSEAELMITSKM